jgi:hypothetical protein
MEDWMIGKMGTKGINLLFIQRVKQELKSE